MLHSLQSKLSAMNALLHHKAVPHEGRLGRNVEEQSDETRFPFQRDRDRILQTTAFRRLQGKTQVFVAGEGDHFRTRLTHTMEVAQIGRDVARAMGMNEDLTECICLAHDLGHPPFGHVGEEGIDEWMETHGSHFEHNEQSFRIITLLEKRSSLYKGLNLNKEVEEGLLKHTDIHPLTGKKVTASIEAHIANLADEIAYTSHDIDDGLLGGLFSMNTLKDIPLAKEAYERSGKRGTQIRGAIAHMLVADLLEASNEFLEGSAEEGSISFSIPMRQSLHELRSFLASNMYSHPRVRLKAKEGKEIVKSLCRFYMQYPTNKVESMLERTGGRLETAVKDYVAGMTDSFAWMQAAEHGLLATEG